MSGFTGRCTPDAGRCDGIGRRLALAAALVALLGALGGCSKGSEAAPGGPPPAPVVRTLVVAPVSVPNRIALLGRVEPFRVAEVRARTDGLIERVVYREGSDVKAGDPLFRIDPQSDQASVDEAGASLDSARVAAANARRTSDRYATLAGQQAISRQQADDSREAAQAADAEVARAEAALQLARITLGYTDVVSPIDGRAGRTEVRRGVLVSGIQGTLLTTVRQTDRVYVNLAESAEELLAVRARIDAGTIALADTANVPVELVDVNGASLGERGRIDFLDQTVDEATGTVVLRAVVPNPDGRLLPGQVVDAVVHAGTRPAALVVPQKAVLLSVDSAAVMVVVPGGAGRDDGKAPGEGAGSTTVKRRTVELGPMHDGGWIIESGLSPGDEIVLDNLQKLRDGAPVRLARPEPGTGAASGGGTGGTTGAVAPVSAANRI